MAQKLESGPLQIHHGHTDTQVFIKFSRVTEHLLLTPQQADDLITAVQNSKKMLAEHIAGGKKVANG